MEAFELLSLQVGRLSEEQYLGYFMSGLKQKIQRRVRALNPQNQMQLMRMAKDVEDELKEEHDEGERNYGKNRMGCNESNSMWSKTRNGLNPAHKDFT